VGQSGQFVGNSENICQFPQVLPACPGTATARLSPATSPIPSRGPKERAAIAFRHALGASGIRRRRGRRIEPGPVGLPSPENKAGSHAKSATAIFIKSCFRKRVIAEALDAVLADGAGLGGRRNFKSADPRWCIRDPHIMPSAIAQGQQAGDPGGREKMAWRRPPWNGTAAIEAPDRTP
jgi:hypothetical protein